MLTKYFASIALLGCLTPALPQQIEIKMGTLAPENSPWHEILQEHYKKEESEISIETINWSRRGKRLGSLMYALLFVGSMIPSTVTGSNTYCAAAKPPEAST